MKLNDPSTMILPIMILAILIVAVFIAVGIFPLAEKANPIDPRSPPAGVKPGMVSHHTERTEFWSNVPINSKQTGGTEAASIETWPPEKSTTDRTDKTDELFDYGSRAREPASGRSRVEDPFHAEQSIAAPCDGTCLGVAPVPIYPPSVRSGPPAPAWIGEVAPFWYEKEGQYREPDWPAPGDEPEKKGLFARLRDRRAGR